MEDGVRVDEIDRVPVRVGASERVRVLVGVIVTVLDGVVPRESDGVTDEVPVLVLDGVEDAVGRAERVRLRVLRGVKVLVQVLVLVCVAEGDAPALRLAEGEADWLGVGVPDGSTTLKVMIASLCRSRGG